MKTYLLVDTAILTKSIITLRYITSQAYKVIYFLIDTCTVSVCKTRIIKESRANSAASEGCHRGSVGICFQLE